MAIQSKTEGHFSVFAKNYLKERNVVYFLLLYSRKRFFRKGFLFACMQLKLNRKGFLPLIANILFVSINFMLEKVFVRFFIQMNAHF